MGGMAKITGLPGRDGVDKSELFKLMGNTVVGMTHGDFRGLPLTVFVTRLNDGKVGDEHAKVLHVIDLAILHAKGAGV